MLCLIGAAAGCSAPASSGGAAARATLPEVRLDAAQLDLRAFAAEAAFLFPEETRELTRSLLRAEFAAREAERLGLAADSARLNQEMTAFEDSLRQDLGGEAADFELWARQRYGRSWEEVRRVLSEHLGRNQLYQLCVRAEASRQTRVRMHWLVTGDAAEAESWARQLRSGVDPRTLLTGSLVRGREPDGSFAPMAARLPQPHQEALAGAAPGTVLGPLRFDGDRSFWVGRVAEVEAALGATPPAQELLAELDRRPLELLEGRTWFESMLRRYTANDGAISIAAPQPAFVAAHLSPHPSSNPPPGPPQ